MRETYFNTWEEFKAYVSENYSENLGLVFRGQRDSSWGIESTLTRLAKSSRSELKASELEALQLENFALKIRGLRGRNPSDLDSIESWSLGQHYGLATPLVDWTESLYIAAYFAFEQIEESSTGYRSIFVLNRAGLECDPKFDKIPNVSFYESTQHDNKRIISQAGLFTVTPTWKDLIKVLEKCNLGKKYLMKLYIPDIERELAIADLRTMNIHGLSIYPDLHGAASVCNSLLETMSNKHRTRIVLDKMEKTIKKHKERMKLKEEVQP